MKKITFIFTSVILFVAAIQAQVTIGSAEKPIPGALLDLKQWSETFTSSTTANKGLLLPRVSLKAANQLTPLYGGVMNGDETWTDHSTNDEKLSSTGVVVYNTNKKAINIYRMGIYVWDGEKWVALTNNMSSYTVDCDKIVVNGEYKKNEPLNASNTITMEIVIASGGTYKITTDAIHGISFAGEGILPEGTHTITLEGTGTLTRNNPFDITIHAKTINGTIACSTTIPVIYPNMTYAVIGANGSYYTWAGDPRKSLLTASTQPGGNFSPTGIVRVGKLSLWGTVMTSALAARTALGWDYFTANGALDPSIIYPDVILYYSYGVPADTQLAQLLSAYINAGGGVLFASHDGDFSPVNIMMEQIFGLPNNVAAVQVNGNDDVYPIANLPTDPIINGPFGNLSNKHWGEDNGSPGSIILKQLPANSVQICTAQSEMKSSVPLSYSIVWYNNDKNFVYIGDSTGATTSTATSSSDFPTKYNRIGNVGNYTYFPQSKIYGPSATYQKEVYNAALELNALAWLIQQAAESGINPH